uniref:Nodule-specific cysteine-rich peptide G52 n=1 Tax=Pisum sativum TaxID=3888 RepID=A0A7T8IGC2_PEA|nr:nodule-specific cysteine-rich peptide G52 [Pisum sativum]
MPEIVKFVYIMITFSFLTIIVTNVEGFRCEEDSDCPRRYCPFAFRPRCLLSYCICERFML